MLMDKTTQEHKSFIGVLRVPLLGVLVSIPRLLLRKPSCPCIRFEFLTIYSMNQLLLHESLHHCKVGMGEGPLTISCFCHQFPVDKMNTSFG